MRSRERLIEVLHSIPQEKTFDQCTLRDARRVLTNELTLFYMLINQLNNVIRKSPSPHYSELASEALHYIKRDYALTQGTLP